MSARCYIEDHPQHARGQLEGAPALLGHGVGHLEPHELTEEPAAEG